MTKTINFKIDWLVIFLIMLPTFYIAGTETRHIQMNFFQMAIFLLIALFHVNRYIGLFLLWGTFQFIFFKDLPEKSFLIQNIFFAAVLYHFIVKYSTPAKKYFWALFAVLILSVIWVPLQMFQIDPIWSMKQIQFQTVFSEYSGFFALPAIFGNYAAAVLPFSFLLSPWLIPFVAVALVCSKSTFSVIAAFLASLFFFWFKKRIIFWLVLVFFGSGVLVYAIKYDLPTGQFERRFNIWGLIIKQAFQNQFLGHGIGSYHNKYTFLETSPSMANKMVRGDQDTIVFLIDEAKKLKHERRDELVHYLESQSQDTFNFGEIKKKCLEYGMDFQAWSEAHNEFIQTFFEFGLIGLGLVGMYIYDLFKRFFYYGLYRDRLSLALGASFIAILVISFAHFPFHIARLAGPFIVIMALFETSILKVLNVIT